MSINLIYTQLKKTQTAVVRLNEDGSHSILVNLIERIAHDRELDEDIDEEFFYHVVNSKDV